MRFVLCVLAALAGGCRGKTEPPPDPPDISALVSDWSTQTGTLDGDTGRALLQSVADDYERLQQRVGLLQEALDAQGGFDADEEDLEQGLAVKRQALEVEAGGWARITYICPGADTSVVDEANGKLRLQAVYDDGGIRDRLVWGAALECLLGERPFDGDLNLWLGEDDGPQVVDFDGTLSGEAFDFELGLQTIDAVDAEGEDVQQSVFLDRRQVDGDSFLVGFTEETLTDLGGDGDGDGYTFGIVDANTTWTCRVAADYQSAQCTDSEGGALSW